MDALTPLSTAVLGQLGHGVSYLNEGTIVFATGNGLVLQDVDTGAQVSAAATHPCMGRRRRLAPKAQLMHEARGLRSTLPACTPHTWDSPVGPCA
jgi:hypothetical protein